MKILFSKQGFYFIAFVAVVLAGIWWLVHRSQFVIVDNAQLKAELLTVRSRIEGQVLFADIASRYTQVEAGQVLVVIDDVDIEAQIVTLQTKIIEIESEIEILMAAENDDLALAQVEESQNVLQKQKLAFELEQKTAELRRSTEMLDRMSTLNERGYSTIEALRESEEVVQEDRTQQSALQTALDQALGFDEELAVRRRKINRTKLRIKGLEDTLSGLQAELKILEERRSHYTFQSAFDGIVNEFHVQEGDFVTQSQRLYTIHSPDSLYLEAKIFEADLHRVEIGARVQVSVDAYPNETLAGTVQRIGSVTTSQSTVLPDSSVVPNFIRIRQLIPIRIKLEETDVELIPGLLATVKLKK